MSDGQTSFSYFSLVSVQSHTVSKSVRPYGGPEPKNVTDKTNKHTQIRSGNTLNVTDGTIQEQTCRTINITFSQYAMQCNAMQCNTIQYNAMQ
jgi:hypothetical protein